MISVEYFKASNGSEPAKNFIDSLPPKLQAKTLRAIGLLEEFGIATREPVSKFLQDGIFELRVSVGSDTSRVLYFFYVGDKAVLTHGFVKKTRRTPSSELERARIYREEYLKQNAERS